MVLITEGGFISTSLLVQSCRLIMTRTGTTCLANTALPFGEMKTKIDQIALFGFQK